MTVRVVEVVIWPVLRLVLAVELGDGVEQVQSRFVRNRG